MFFAGSVVVHDEDVRRGRDARDRHEVLDRIVRQVLAQVGQDRVDRRRRQQQRVAVGRATSRRVPRPARRRRRRGCRRPPAGRGCSKASARAGAPSWSGAPPAASATIELDRPVRIRLRARADRAERERQRAAGHSDAGASWFLRGRARCVAAPSITQRTGGPSAGRCAILSPHDAHQPARAHVRRAQSEISRGRRPSVHRHAQPRCACRARHALHVSVHDLPDLRAGAGGIRRRPLRARHRLLGQRRRLRRRDPELAPRAARRRASRRLDRQAAFPRPSGRRPRLLRRDRADAHRRRHRRRQGPGPREHPEAQGRRQDGASAPAPASRLTPSTTATSRRARRSGCTRRRRSGATGRGCCSCRSCCPHFPLTAPPHWFYRYWQQDLPMPKQYAKGARPHHPFLDDLRAHGRLRSALRVRRPMSSGRSPAMPASCRRWTRTSATCCARCATRGSRRTRA